MQVVRQAGEAGARRRRGVQCAPVLIGWRMETGTRLARMSDRSLGSIHLGRNKPTIHKPQPAARVDRSRT
jgi:hypothetical protein